MKGLSDITLKGRHSRINDFSFFIQDKTDLAHLNISVIDEYIQYSTTQDVANELFLFLQQISEST